MKIAVVVVLYHTPQEEVVRLTKEIDAVGLSDFSLHFIDNSGTGKGYAYGVNEGIKKGIDEGAELFLVLNPDVSLSGLRANEILSGAGRFDIWGLAMKQEGKTYYAGEIEKWRMSGGLSETKPASRFSKADYVTGSLMFIKKTVIDRIGLMDERYFMYYEDVDYSERARRAGFRVGIDSANEYTHFETSRSYAGKRYQMAKNRLLFLMKFGSWQQKLREIIRAPKTVIEDRILLTTGLRSTFFVSFLGLNSSAFIAKGLNFLLFLAMIRHIPVRDYGIYTLVWAHVTILSPIVDFGTTAYGMVYLPREKQDKIQALFSLRLVLSLIVFAVTLLLAFAFHYSQQILFYIFLTSFVIFFNIVSGTYLIVSSVNNELVKNSVVSTITNSIMVLILILTVMKTGSLSILFYAIGFFYALYAVLYFYLIRASVGKIRLTFPVREWGRVIQKSYVFVLISLFAGIYFKIDVFILNLLKGTVAVGTYSSGYKFFEATILLVSSYNTLSTPILSRTAHHDRKRLMPTVTKHFLFLAAVGLSVVLLTQTLGSFFLPYILKGNYVLAVDVVKIVIWALPFMLFNSIFLNLLYAVDLSRIVVLIFIGISVLNGVLNLMFIPHYSFIASSYLTVLSEITDFIILTVIVFFIYRKKIFYG